MVAPSWAISLTVDKRSSRAIRESCKVEGIASGGIGTLPCAPTYRPSSSRNTPDSTTVLVNSSTNKGTPSVLATICCITSRGRALPPVTRFTIVSTCGRSKRLSVSWLRCERLPQGGVNSGRKVSSTYRRAVGTCSTTTCNTSSVDGSAQCTSSHVV